MPSPSWRHLIDALKTRAVDETRLAEEIEEKNCSSEKQHHCDKTEDAMQDQGTDKNLD